MKAIGAVKVGTKTVNLNRRGVLFWPTRAVITALDPQKKLSFRVNTNDTEWTYDLEPAGTPLRHRAARADRGMGEEGRGLHRLEGADQLRVIGLRLVDQNIDPVLDNAAGDGIVVHGTNIEPVFGGAFNAGFKIIFRFDAAIIGEYFHFVTIMELKHLCHDKTHGMIA